MRQQSIKILFVDDEEAYSCALPDNSEAVQVRYDYDFAFTVKEAIAQLKYNSFGYDIIVVDLKFGTENLAGLKVFKYLAEQKVEIPSIIITAYANDKNLLKCIEQRPYGLLKKPFDFEELQKLIQKVLKKAAQNRRAKRPSISTARKMLREITGQSKVDVLVGGLESLTLAQYEEVLMELPAVEMLIQEEELTRDKNKVDKDSWKDSGIPVHIINKANVYLECQQRTLASGEKKIYGPFVYMRWMDDGEQDQYYAGKLTKITDVNLIRKLHHKYENDEVTRGMDRFKAIPLLYKKYCKSSKSTPKKR